MDFGNVVGVLESCEDYLRLVITVLKCKSLVWCFFFVRFLGSGVGEIEWGS